MSVFVFLAAIFVVAAKYCLGGKKATALTLTAGFSLAAAIRVLLAVFAVGYVNDLVLFSMWSRDLSEFGFSGFYEGSKCDYPPGCLYLLRTLSPLAHSLTNERFFAILKFIPVVFDALLAAVFFRFLKSNNADLRLAVCYLLCPAVIINGAWWGQVDSIVAFILLVFIILITQKKLLYAMLIFALGVLTKPQMLFYTPVLMYAVYEFLKEGRGIKKLLVHILLTLLLCLAVMLPFGVDKVISCYLGTLASYPYATVYAANLWAALGQNMTPLAGIHSMTAYLLLFSGVVFAFVYMSKSSSKAKYYHTAAFLCMLAFTVSVKMHERYALPALIMLLCAYATDGRKSSLYTFLSLGGFLTMNIGYMLYNQGFYEQFDSEISKVIFSLGYLMLAIFIGYTVSLIKEIRGGKRN